MAAGPGAPVRPRLTVRAGAAAWERPSLSPLCFMRREQLGKAQSEADGENRRCRHEHRLVALCSST